jgi:hypothetical protein
MAVLNASFTMRVMAEVHSARYGVDSVECGGKSAFLAPKLSATTPRLHESNRTTVSLASQPFFFYSLHTFSPSITSRYRTKQHLGNLSLL